MKNVKITSVIIRALAYLLLFSLVAFACLMVAVVMGHWTLSVVLFIVSLFAMVWLAD